MSLWLIEFINLLSKETAKISSNAEKSILHLRSQLINWPLSACMIESYSDLFKKRHNLCQRKLHIPNRSKCKKHLISKTYHQNKYQNNNLLNLVNIFTSNNSLWLWSMSTAKLQTHFTGTKCLKS